MSLEDSPSLDDIQDGFDASQKTSHGMKSPLRRIILALVVVAVIISGINLMRSDTVARMRGTGTLTGQVVDEKSEPLQADVIILGTEIQTTTNAEGNFTLSGVPAGTQSLIIGHQGAALEYPITLSAGETLNMGQIKFVSTLIPEE